MTRQSATLAVAADYADALMTARRAKNWLFLLLLLILLAQVSVFLLLRYHVLKLEDRAGITPAVAATSGTLGAAVSPTTSPTTAPTTGPIGGIEVTTNTTTVVPAHTVPVDEILRYVTPGFDFLGILFAVLLSVVLLLLAAIMLVGRLVGVSQVTSSFIWSVLLTLVLFPWQAFLISSGHYPISSAYGSSASASDNIYMPGIPEQPAFKIPGVLYTYPELRQDWDFPNQPMNSAVLKWARYVGFPVVALLVLLMLQGKSSRGLKYALGEADIPVDIGGRPHEPLV